MTTEGETIKSSCDGLGRSPGGHSLAHWALATGTRALTRDSAHTPGQVRGLFPGHIGKKEVSDMRRGLCFASVASGYSLWGGLMRWLSTESLHSLSASGLPRLQITHTYHPLSSRRQSILSFAGSGLMLSSQR